MSLATGIHEIRVRYEETDCSGVVYHTNFLNYFEVGRTELLRSLGLPYRRLEESGFLLTVVEAKVRFRRPAHYDDLLRVETEVTEARGARIDFLYRIIRVEDEELLCTGRTLLACLDARKGRPRRLPGSVLSLLTQHTK